MFGLQNLYFILVPLVLFFFLISLTISSFSSHNFSEVYPKEILIASHGENNPHFLKNNFILRKRVLRTPLSVNPSENIFENGFRYCYEHSCSKQFDYEAYEGAKMNGILSWQPLPERFLILDCSYGQASNRVICILNYILVAGLLNRTLIVPSALRGTYIPSVFFDIQHAKNCLGDKAIMTLKEYLKLYKTRPHIDQLNCYSIFACVLIRQGRITYLQRLFDVPSEVKSNASELILIGSNVSVTHPRYTLPEFLLKFANTDARVMLMGDLFYLKILGERKLFTVGGDSPFIKLPACDNSLIVQPHPTLIQSVHLFLDEALPEGRSYLSIHFRRGDFLSFCRKKAKICYLPATEIAECIAQKLKRHNLSAVFIATNAKPREVIQLKNNLLSEIPNLKFFKLPEHLRNNSWALPVKNNKLLTRAPAVIATMEKLACSFANVFLGSYLSSFTRDIQRLRYGFGTAIPDDSFLCAENY